MSEDYAHSSFIPLEIRFQLVKQLLPQTFFWKDRDFRFVDANVHFLKSAGLDSLDQLVGKTDYDLPWNDHADLYRADDQEVLRSGSPKLNIDEKVKNPDGSFSWIRTSKFPITNDAGEVIGLFGWFDDVTREKFIEAESVKLREEIIEAQSRALRELSTPLIPISAQVVAMPLVGTIDEERAQLILETLLSGLGEHQAQVAIIDITGVPVIDTQVADALIKSAQAVRLLGAQVMLTGIRPEVAQTLVSLGADLGSIKTYSNLQSAIFAALHIND